MCGIWKDPKKEEMLKKLRGPLFQDGAKVLARKAGLHHARPFRPYLRVVNTAGCPWGDFRRGVP